MIRDFMLTYVRTCIALSCLIGGSLAFIVFPEFEVNPEPVDMSMIPHYEPKEPPINKPLLCRDDPKCHPNSCQARLAKARHLNATNPNNKNAQHFMNLVRECNPRPLSKLKKPTRFELENNPYLARWDD